MYCTFLRTRCIDCHTSVPEKRHCAIERCWALCFPLAPEARAGGRGGRVGSPSICRQGLQPLPLAAKELERGRALSYLRSRRASGEAERRAHTFPGVWENTLVIQSGGEEICQALPDSIQKETERRAERQTRARRRLSTTAL